MPAGHVPLRQEFQHRGDDDSCFDQDRGGYFGLSSLEERHTGYIKCVWSDCTSQKGLSENMFLSILKDNVRRSKHL